MKKSLCISIVIAALIFPQGMLASTTGSESIPSMQIVEPIEKNTSSVYRRVYRVYGLTEYLPPAIKHQEYINGIYFSGVLLKTKVVKSNGKYHVTFSGTITAK